MACGAVYLKSYHGFNEKNNYCKNYSLQKGHSRFKRRRKKGRKGSNTDSLLLDRSIPGGNRRLSCRLTNRLFSTFFPLFSFGVQKGAITKPGLSPIVRVVVISGGERLHLSGPGLADVY